MSQQKAGHFAICGPGWHGDLPPGVQATLPAPTPWVLLLGRTLVDGDADLPEVHALQAQYRLTPAEAPASFHRWTRSGRWPPTPNKT